MTEVFRDDDAGYERWLAENPGGYVVNARRTPRADYLKLHRAWCRHISSLQPGATTWTSGDYIKVCGRRLDEVERWARSHVGGGLDRGCACT